MKTVRKLQDSAKVLTAILLTVSFVSFFSFNYYYLYGHITSVSDFFFCLLQWFKLAGLVVIPMAVYYNAVKLNSAVKFIYILLPLASLAWCARYFGLQKTAETDIERLYLAINTILPRIVVKILFVAEAVLMSVSALTHTIATAKHSRLSEYMLDDCPALTAYKRPSLASDLRNLRYFLPVFALCIPLNIFQGFVQIILPSENNHQFFRFYNFSVWHFLAVAVTLGATVFSYYLLKNKSSASRYRYLGALALVLLVQYMSKSSMLIGDGYSIYRTLFAAIPLFICNIGVFIASLAIFTRVKLLAQISFFVHAAGAVIVFSYFGSEDLSDFGTIFNYSFLYFTSTHAMLFLICMLPVLLGEQKFRMRNTAVPIIYYAFFIITAAVISRVISNTVFSYGDISTQIFPNYCFTQFLPIAAPLPEWKITVLSLSFDLVLLGVLFLSYVLIFYIIYFLYHLSFGRRHQSRQ